MLKPARGVSRAVPFPADKDGRQRGIKMDFPRIDLKTALDRWCECAADERPMDVEDWCLAMRYRDDVRRHLEDGAVMDEWQHRRLGRADRCMVVKASLMSDYLGFYRWVVQQPREHYAHAHHRRVMASWEHQEPQLVR